MEEDKSTDSESCGSREAASSVEGNEGLQVIGKPDVYVPVDTEDIADLQTPKERFIDLLGAMRAQRAILLGLIDFCRIPRSAEAVDEYLHELTQYQYCVYDGVELRRLLQEAEALLYQEPEQQSGGDSEIGEDGQEYLVIHRRSGGLWLSARCAIEVLEEQDPEREFKCLLEMEPRYEDIYRRILEYCRAQPRSIKELEKLLNNDPLLREPRRYAGYFIERLERNSGIEWRGGWVTTELGERFIGSDQCV
jgi:hypothetical protein